MCRFDEMGVSLGESRLPVECEAEQIEVLVDQFGEAVERAFGPYWSEEMKTVYGSLGIDALVGTTVWEASRVLGNKEIPKVGVLNGWAHGLRRFEGYCWEEAGGEVWVGFDEAWFGDVLEGSLRWGGGLSGELRWRLKEILAEEVGHARVREVRPDLAEESMVATASDDREGYWTNQVEEAVKEFARWYAASSGE